MTSALNFVSLSSNLFSSSLFLFPGLSSLLLAEFELPSTRAFILFSIIAAIVAGATLVEFLKKDKVELTTSSSSGIMASSRPSAVISIQGSTPRPEASSRWQKRAYAARPAGTLLGKASVTCAFKSNILAQTKPQNELET